jgi:hypothetical protein
MTTENADANSATKKRRCKPALFGIEEKIPNYWKLNIGLPPPCSAICEL